MKLKNIFKKETKKNSETNFQKLDQQQVKKVIGGSSVVGLDDKLPDGNQRTVTVKGVDDSSPDGAQY